MIVAVGRLAQEKGHDLLIAAAEQLAVEWPGVRVLIAGDGAGRDALQQMIDETGLTDRIRLLGQVQDVGPLLRAADAFAFPSRREGIPFALLEAMSNTVPAVVANFGGADEIISSGENGLMVGQDDPAALAEAIAGLLRDPTRARMLAERGRERAAQFSEPVMIRSTLALLDATANGGGGR